MDPSLQIIAAPVVAEFAKMIFKDVIQPKFAELRNYFKNSSLQDFEISLQLESSIQSYLTRTKESLESLNSLIADRSQIQLQQVYVPIRLLESGTNKEIEVNIGEELNFESKKNRILITGDGGIGKSTVLRVMGLQALESMRLCPIMVNLRDLSPDHTLLDEIFDQFSELGESAEKEIIIKLLESGRFLILLDAVDEISAKEKAAVLKDIKDFIQKAYLNTFIISSRQDRILTSLSDFFRYNIVEMDFDQNKMLFEKYDIISGKCLSKKLILEIESKFFKSLITNPIIASMIYNVYYLNRMLPTDEIELIRRIFDIYINEHDYSKCGFVRSTYRDINSQKLIEFYSLFAFTSLKKGAPKLALHEFERLISTNIRNKELAYNERDLLNDLVFTSPLFRKEGTDYVWQHKIFEDYFAAEYILQSSLKDQIIFKLYKSTKRSDYLAIFRFLAKLDQDFFVKNISSQVVKDFLSYCEESYVDFEKLGEFELQIRRAVTFGRDIEIMCKEISEKGINLSLEELEMLTKKSMDYFGFIPVKNKGFVMLTKYKSESKILDIMSDMDLDIFDDIRLNKEYHDFFCSAENLSTDSKSHQECAQGDRELYSRNLQGVEIPENLPMNELIKLTDDPSNPYNEIDVFNQVSLLIGGDFIDLARYGRTQRPRILHPEKCRRFLKELELSEDDSIFNGL